MWSVFICYSSHDKEFVERLAHDLSNRGISVWFDKWVLQVGDSLRSKIGEGIRESRYFVVVVSQASKDSKWVAQELDEAFARQAKQKGSFILPVVLDKHAFPPMLSGLVYADFSADYNRGFDALLRVLGSGSLSRDAEVGSGEPVSRQGFLLLRHEESIGIEISSVWQGLREFEDAASAALREGRKWARDVVGRVGASLFKSGEGLGVTTIDTDSGIRVVGEKWSVDAHWELANEEPAVLYDVEVHIDRAAGSVGEFRACPLVVPGWLGIVNWTERGVEFPSVATVEDLVNGASQSLLTLMSLIPGDAGEIVFRSSFAPGKKMSKVHVNRWVDVTVLLGAGRVTVRARPAWEIQDEVEPHLREIWESLRQILDPNDTWGQCT